jgi:hypothetical protein
MSFGLLICAKCSKEVHQIDGAWVHCVDKTARCPGALSIYPKSRQQIQGEYCGRDQFFRDYDQKKAIPKALPK